MANTGPPENVRQMSSDYYSVGVAWNREDETGAVKYEYRLNGGLPVSVGHFSWITVPNLTPGQEIDFEVRAIRSEKVAEPVESEFGPAIIGPWSSPITLVAKDIRTLIWNAPEERTFEAGLDRGVLYPRGKEPVVWNGLVSVDQTGVENVVSYYMDGRPYLHVAQPKEYQATLKAWTFPDAFSAIMGEPEVADGMYLDSQTGDMFDLSYRTRVGNATENSELGYKIHLVYNATVAPQNTSYETFAAEVNPSSFTWDIYAVPEVVPGYRATAHIVIDTRHMSADKIQKVERLLYGGMNIDAHMPSPSTILDLLSLEADIIITDHGDGTWTAEGAFANVQITEPGYFRITNVNSTDLGDGSYTISSTSA